MFDPLTAPHRSGQQTVNVLESPARLQAATRLRATRREGWDDGVPFQELALHLLFSEIGKWL
jgi:hypothetical protein